MRRRTPPTLPSSEAASLGVLHAQQVLRAALAETDDGQWFAASLERRPEVLTYAVGALAVAFTQVFRAAYQGDDDRAAPLGVIDAMTDDAAAAQAIVILAEAERTLTA